MERFGFTAMFFEFKSGIRFLRIKCVLQSAENEIGKIDQIRNDHEYSDRAGYFFCEKHRNIKQHARHAQNKCVENRIDIDRNGGDECGQSEDQKNVVDIRPDNVAQRDVAVAFFYCNDGSDGLGKRGADGDNCQSDEPFADPCGGSDGDRLSND